MKEVIGIIGAGTMGAGIAQVAAQAGHQVILVDQNQAQLDLAKANLEIILNKLLSKEKITITQHASIASAIRYEVNNSSLASCSLVIEAIVENLAIKHSVFSSLEEIVSATCILATNTSSLSIASIGSVLKNPSRIIGIHFFNPAPLMPLVEIIPAVQTSQKVIDNVMTLIGAWGKTAVLCKDTPGFIVNRVARPFYGEALRIFEEGIADFATIDWAMTSLGGFKMGPFTLMDYIGNDINYTVTESVFEAFYYDPRFKPSLTQMRYKEAGYLGRKSGKGFYDYAENAAPIIAKEDIDLGQEILDRILALLINEAVDAVFMQVSSVEGVDLAMTKGVNYPKGLLKWADEIGLNEILLRLEDLQLTYGEDRYRPNPLLRKMVKENLNFYPK